MPKTSPTAACCTTDRVRSALRQLAACRPLDKLRHAEIARVAGLPWQTVRKLLGPRERFAEWLADENTAPGDTRSRILAAAARVFAERGFDRSSIDEVAAAAGLTKGAVYWHFKSKDELFFALLDQRCAAMEAYLPQAVTDAVGRSSGNPRQALITLMSGLFRHLAADPEWSRLSIEFFSRTRDAAIRERLAERWRQFYAIAVATIRANNPDFPQQSAEDLAVFWTALIDGLLFASLLHPDGGGIADRLERILEILWDGLGQRGPFATATPAPSSLLPPESA